MASSPFHGQSRFSLVWLAMIVLSDCRSGPLQTFAWTAISYSPLSSTERGRGNLFPSRQRHGLAPVNLIALSRSEARSDHTPSAPTSGLRMRWRSMASNSRQLSSRTRNLTLKANPYSLVSATDSWGNWAVLTGMAAAAQSLGTKTRVGQWLGPPVTAMALVFALASVGILPSGGTAAARALQLLALQLATPLVLLGADLRQVGSGGHQPLLLSFVAAAAATLVGAQVGWSWAGMGLQRALGARDGAIIAAALLAKNIGGGLNYIAVCQALQASPTAVAAGLCVDNIMALVYFPITSILAHGVDDVNVETGESSSAENTDSSRAAPSEAMTVPSISQTLFLSAALLWLGEKCPGPALPMCSLFTVVTATVLPRKWLTESLQPTSQALGTVCLYMFFATAGAPGWAVAGQVQASVVPLLQFLTALYAIHGALLAGLRWTTQALLPETNKQSGSASLKSFLQQAVQVPRLLVASSASIGGPATAVALAEASGWRSLVVPSVLVGNIGYAVATFIALWFFGRTPV